MVQQLRRPPGMPGWEHDCIAAELFGAGGERLGLRTEQHRAFGGHVEQAVGAVEIGAARSSRTSFQTLVSIGTRVTRRIGRSSVTTVTIVRRAPSRLANLRAASNAASPSEVPSYATRMCR